MIALPRCCSLPVSRPIGQGEVALWGGPQEEVAQGADGSEEAAHVRSSAETTGRRQPPSTLQIETHIEFK